MTTYVVTDYDGCDYITAGKRYEVTFKDDAGFCFCTDNGDEAYSVWEDSAHIKGPWTVIEEPDTPKTWGEMTDAEKGALLLARHEGKNIQYKLFPAGRKNYAWLDIAEPTFGPDHAYRIKPEPVVGEVVLHGGGDYGCGNCCFSDEDIECDTHTLTLPTLDGKLVTGEFANEDGMKVVIEEKK